MNLLKKIAVIGFGSTMISIGINGFILPFHLMNGGFFGISLLLNYLWGFQAGLTFILLNIPVYLFALKTEPYYFYNGLFGVIVSGLMMDFLMPLNGLFHLSIISSVIIGGGLIGLGVGVMLRNHISPGGMDLLALLFAKWTRVNVGIIMVVMDMAVILTGLLLIRDPRLLYSLLIISIIGLIATIITSYRQEFSK